MSCNLCHHKFEKKSQETLVLLKFIRILEIEKKKHERLISLPNEIHFRQLLDYLMEEKPNTNEKEPNCPHTTIKQILVKKLSIDMDELYSLCEGIWEKFSRRKFELELVEKITKNIHEKVLTLEVKGEVRGFKKREKLSKVKEIEEKPESPTATSQLANFNLMMEQNSGLNENKSDKTFPLMPSFQFPLLEQNVTQNINTNGEIEHVGLQWNLPIEGYSMLNDINGYCFMNGLGRWIG